jgi:RNA polymerase sigma factor for flagellar operon FliA
MTQTPTRESRSGEALFLSELPLIERVIAFVSHRHRLTADMADDFASAVKLKLIENDYAILRGFQGRSSLQTYLTVVIQRCFLDLRAAAWGKWRPSAEAKRLGPLAVQLEQLQTRDRMTFEEACETLCARHADVSRQMVFDLSAKLPARTPRRFESEEQLANVTVEAEAETLPDREERRELAGRLEKAMTAALGALSAQDRLVLQLRFADGLSVADIARALKLDQKPLYRRVDRLLDDLRQRLEDAGLRPSEVRDALAEPGFDFSLTALRRESAMPGPSITKGASR